MYVIGPFLARGGNEAAQPEPDPSRRVSCPDALPQFFLLH
jgi:hypothetical protein